MTPLDAIVPAQREFYARVKAARARMDAAVWKPRRLPCPPRPVETAPITVVAAPAPRPVMEPAIQTAEDRARRWAAMQDAGCMSRAMAEVEKAAADAGVTPAAVLSASRRQPETRARQMAMAAVYQANQTWSIIRVGRFFGRDHTTVLHALRKLGVETRGLNGKPRA